MLRYFLMSLLILPTVALTLNQAQAAVIAEAGVYFNGTIEGTEPEFMETSWSYFDGSDEVRLFDWLVLHKSDVGTVFSAFPETNPAFSVFADFLTNGVDDLLVYRTKFPNDEVNFGFLESEMSSLQPNSLNGIDLQGHMITQIDYTLDLFEVRESLTGLPGVFNYEVQHRYSIHDGIVVPEPTSVVLFMIGGLAALATNLSHRRRISLHQ